MLVHMTNLGADLRTGKMAKQVPKPVTRVKP